MALTKRDALEYLARQTEPVTAKALSIDLDTRASTASELLERMAAQGLVSRDPKQRPRQYVLTEAGREQLGFSRAQDRRQGNPHASSASNQNPDSPENRPDPVALLSRKMDALGRHVTSQLEALREDLVNMMEVLLPDSGSARSENPGDPPSSGNPTSLASEVESLLREGEESADQTNARTEKPQAVELYKARRELEPKSLLSRKSPLRKRVAELERQLGPQVVEAVSRVLELEGWPGFFGLSEEEREEMARLREKLGLPPVEDAEEESEDSEE